MKLKTVTYKLYDFAELSETAKEKVRRDYLDDPIRCDFLSEDFANGWVDYFFPNSKLSVGWSLGYCQGDGVNIYGDLNFDDVFAYIEHYNPDEHKVYHYTYDPRGKYTEKQIKRLKHYVCNLSGCKIPNNHHYGYCVASRIDFAGEVIDELEYVNYSNIDTKLIEHFQGTVIKIIKHLCAEMEQYGYNYLYEVEDEEIIEASEANGWMYHADGRLECYDE